MHIQTNQAFRTLTRSPVQLEGPQGMPWGMQQSGHTLTMLITFLSVSQEGFILATVAAWKENECSSHTYCISFLICWELLGWARAGSFSWELNSGLFLLFSKALGEIYGSQWEIPQLWLRENGPGCPNGLESRSEMWGQLFASGVNPRGRIWESFTVNLSLGYGFCAKKVGFYYNGITSTSWLYCCQILVETRHSHFCCEVSWGGWGNFDLASYLMWKATVLFPRTLQQDSYHVLIIPL